MFEWARGVEIREVTDGTSNTVLVAETSRAIPWTQPDDPPFDRDGPLPQFGSGHSGGFHVIFADGVARFIKSSIESQTLKSLLTRDGGEVISGDPDRNRSAGRVPASFIGLDQERSRCIRAILIIFADQR